MKDVVWDSADDATLDIVVVCVDRRQGTPSVTRSLSALHKKARAVKTRTVKTRQVQARPHWSLSPHKPADPLHAPLSLHVVRTPELLVTTRKTGRCRQASDGTGRSLWNGIMSSRT